MATGMERVAAKARSNQKLRFTSLAHHTTPASLCLNLHKLCTMKDLTLIFFPDFLIYLIFGLATYRCLISRCTLLNVTSCLVLNAKNESK